MPRSRRSSSLAAIQPSLAAIQRIAGMIALILLAPTTDADELQYRNDELQYRNWTRFRGPNGSGYGGDIVFPAEWSEDDYLWKRPLPGKGHSSPIGWEDKLFVTTGDPETGDVTLLCLSASDGSELWQRKFAGHPFRMHAGNSYASATPTVNAQHVYLTWSDGGQLRCVALTHDGDERWRTDLGDFVEQHGFAASPVVVEGVVCVQVDEVNGGHMVALDAKSGDERWRVARPAGKASYACVCEVGTHDGQTSVIVQSMAGGMQAVAVASGEVVWQLDDAFPARCVSSPIVSRNLVLGVCGGGGSGKLLVGIDPKTSAEPQEKLRLTKQVPYVPTPLVVKKKLLFLWHDQGKVSLAELDGSAPVEKVSWTERVGGKFFGSPIVAGDKIYCLSMDGRAVVIAADRDFQLLGDNDLGDPSNATPAVHQGRLYLRTESTLACLPPQ